MTAPPPRPTSRHQRNGSRSIKIGDGGFYSVPPAEEQPEATLTPDASTTQDDASAVELEPARSRAGETLQGRIERVTEAQLEGWAWDPLRPNKRIVLELVKDSDQLAVTVADGYRPDLVQLGCGDGRHGFVIRLAADLLTEGRHVLRLRCADTGAMLPSAPVLDVPSTGATTDDRSTNSEAWELTRPARPFTNGLVADAVSRPPDDASRFLSTLRKISAGRPVRHTVSRGDFARYDLARRFTAEGATPSVLSIADCVRATGTIPSGFFTDTMIAAWLSRDDVQQRFPRLDDEACQYAFLAWFLCVRPVEDGLLASSEPTGPILAAMSEKILEQEQHSGIGCTALMLAAYCYVASYDGSTMTPPSQCPAREIVAWFLCEGAYHLRVSHAVTQHVRAQLAVARSHRISPVLEWAADRMPAVAPTDDSRIAGHAGILSWLYRQNAVAGSSTWRDLLRECSVVAGCAQFDDPPEPAVPDVCGRLRDVMRNPAEWLVIDGQPEYTCVRGDGERLLLQGEWYPVEPTFVWSRTPISTILFCMSPGPVEWLRIGLMFNQAPRPDRNMRVFLNHNRLWSGTIDDASRDELILACSGRCFSQDGPNLLQFEIDEAFVPAQWSPSDDHRRLGVGLKRFWIQRTEGTVRHALA